MPITVGIETSCDETAVAVLGPDGEVLHARLASQIDAHAVFGGVVPELASREHLKALPFLVEEALETARPEMVAVTAGPGLMGSLLVGLRYAAAFAWARKLPFIGVDHLFGHRMSAFLSLDGKPAREMPARVLALVASGGHSSWYFDDLSSSKQLNRTRDDAAGECMDKIGKVLGLPYPAGPEMDRLARDGDPTRFSFRLPRLRTGGDDFSFSGLKSAAIRRIGEASPDDRGDPGFLRDMAASVENAVIRQLLAPLEGFARTYRPEILTVSGGVSANTLLRREFASSARKLGIPCLVPPKDLTGDNAVMIARAGQVQFQRTGGDDPRRIDAQSRKLWHPPGMRRILEDRR